MVNLVKYGIPEEFSDLTWEGIRDLPYENAESKKYREIYKIARKWTNKLIEGQRPDMGLFLCGSNGSGKTSLACLILRSLLEENVSAYRVTMVKMQAEYFDNWRVPETGLLNVVLAIDELGKEPKTKAEHSESAFEYIIKYRAERNFPTILIANADIGYLRGRYGETVNSVLRGRFIPLNFPEVDFRQRIGSERLKQFLEEGE